MAGPTRKRHSTGGIAHEYKVVSLRECPLAFEYCDNPRRAVAYWRRHIQSHPYFNPDVECLAVLLLDARQRIKGHVLVGIGILNSVLAHPREIFRPLICAAAHGFILFHNHPSGDPTPTEEDVRITLRLKRAAKILEIIFHDHLIIGRRSRGNPYTYASLRQHGHFHRQENPHHEHLRMAAKKQLLTYGYD